MIKLSKPLFTPPQDENSHSPITRHTRFPPLTKFITFVIAEYLRKKYHSSPANGYCNTKLCFQDKSAPQ